MGLIRKATSLSTLGLVDFRSDKERTASYTKRSASEGRKQTALLTAQLEQMRVNQFTQVAPQSTAPAPGWYQGPQDPMGLTRWWDGSAWGQLTQGSPVNAVEPRPTPTLPAAINPAPERPANWYPCPSGERKYRWWDGAAWTEQIQPIETDR